ncbi:NAD(P)/FAD-dependent oxidoreductase [Saccharothrix australiensis]|uniref:3-phenylpropionate/trans-cinnamate dioxygenase ferredoxin reductase subunit n=1 Tax=Saccharothrix australiensis TaxID=2072 RepID=A0A495W1R6_9PSEU|nr:FAD-dependent oxidoreductase [Saccharothrix australiensis]RKT54655.1 3-phenylpropionate/trans-cinnamate dioxygenase ferredoxin reductase subunit [Saccharothrix australiensis]
MSDGRVVVVGAGQAGAQVAVSLRERGHAGAITVVGAEPDLPYQRPPLSKDYLAGSADEDALPLRPAHAYERLDVRLRTGDPVESVDQAARTVRTRAGVVLGWDHLVLATGSVARTLPVPGAVLAGVCPLRTLADAVEVRERLRTAEHVVVLGGGFTGLEVASAASAGAHVTVLEVGPRLLGRALSAEVAADLLARHRDRGVRVLLGDTAVRLDGDHRVRSVVTASGARLPADLVVVGAGVRPATDLAAACGLPTADGVLVDAWLRTANPAVYAIGDCASHPTPRGRVRLESVQNAVDQARFVAGHLTGETDPYRALPRFWTTQHGARVQVVGLARPADDAVARPTEKGLTVFRVAGSRLVAVETVGHTADHVAARRLLGSAADHAVPFSPESPLKAPLSA